MFRKPTELSRTMNTVAAKGRDNTYVMGIGETIEQGAKAAVKQAARTGDMTYMSHKGVDMVVHPRDKVKDVVDAYYAGLKELAKSPAELALAEKDREAQKAYQEKTDALVRDLDTVLAKDLRALLVWAKSYALEAGVHKKTDTHAKEVLEKLTEAGYKATKSDGDANADFEKTGKHIIGNMMYCLKKYGAPHEKMSIQVDKCLNPKSKPAGQTNKM